MCVTSTANITDTLGSGIPLPGALALLKVYLHCKALGIYFYLYYFYFYFYFIYFYFHSISNPPAMPLKIVPYYYFEY